MRVNNWKIMRLLGVKLYAFSDQTEYWGIFGYVSKETNAISLNLKKKKMYNKRHQYV